MSIILSLASRLFRLLSISSLWIAFVSAFGPTLIGEIYQIEVKPAIPLIVFLVTFAIYALDKVSGSVEDLLNTPDRAVLSGHPVKRAAALSYAVAIILVLAVDPPALPAVLIPGLAGILYTSRIHGVRPKDIPGCKNVVVAASTAVCYAGLLHACLSAYMLIFLLIWIDTVLFDCRDVVGDASSGVRTIPVLLGPSRTLALVGGFNLLLFAISPLVAAVGCLLIVYFRKNRNVLAYDLLVDGWMMWSCIAILLFKFS